MIKAVCQDCGWQVLCITMEEARMRMSQHEVATRTGESEEGTRQIKNPGHYVSLQSL